MPTTSLLALAAPCLSFKGFRSEHPRVDLVHTPLPQLPLQGAQRQTVIPTKLVLSQSTRFKFKHQPLDLLATSSLPPRDFLVSSH
jgi:hypothetical protein